MQALSLSLSPAGRGDDKKVSSTAPAEEGESRADVAEENNFAESFKTASSKKEESPETSSSKTEVAPEIKEVSGTKETSNKSEKESSLVAALPAVESQTTPHTPSKGEELSGKTNIASANAIQASSTAEEAGDIGGTLKTDDKAKSVKTAEATQSPQTTPNEVAPKAEVSPKADLAPKTQSDAAGDKKLSDAAVTKETAESNSSLKHSETGSRDQSDNKLPISDKKQAESAAAKETANLNANIKPSKIESREESGKKLPKSEKTASASETDLTSKIKQPTNLVEADSIEKALNKQVDQKAFGQADFFGDNSDGSIKSALLQSASSTPDGSFALTGSLTAPTISSSLSPNIQMISANASAAVTNFNAVSQAMLVANKTAKGVTVQLDPPEMGRVYIDFAFDVDDKVNVVVKSDLPESHLMLRDRSEQFLGFLKESGLENVTLSFEQNGQNDGSGFDEQDTPNPLYMTAPADEPLPFNSPLRTPSNDVQTYDGLDLRL